MKVPLIIYGAGGLGREILSLVRSLPQYEVLGFLDDGVAKGTLVKGVKVLGGIEVLHSSDHPVNLVLAIGDPKVKASIVRGIKSPNIEYPILRHPTAVIQDEAAVVIGKGTILCAGSILTTDIHLGSHVLVNLNTTIGHDTSIGNYSSLMPGVNVSGEVTIGNSVLIGSGSSILNRVQIGDRCVIGIGSVVNKDIEPGVTAAGVPARGIRRGEG